MNTPPNGAPAISIEGLVYAYGRQDAVRGLDLRVERGRCYGLFGRNGAGKTTAIKCLLNLLRPKSGRVSVFGFDPSREEVAVKRRIAYVPDQVAFYPWMSVREALDYLSSFREHWNRDLERDLLSRFSLDLRQKISGLSKGQRTQLALLAAIAPEPELLVLDEPTSGLDPVVRREFIETVIGAYQESAPGDRTVLVSTHLIAEFEGLIDEFTIMDQGRAVLSLGSDQARGKYSRIRARFAEAAPIMSFPGALVVRADDRDLEVIANGHSEDILGILRRLTPESLTSEALTLEEIFVNTVQTRATHANSAI